MDLDFRPDLMAILSPLRRGRADPATRITSDGWFWRAALTPAGPVTQALRAVDRVVHSRTWGPGAQWQNEHLPQLLGAADRPPPGIDGLIDAAISHQPGSRSPAARVEGWRTPRAGNVWENLLAAVLEQKVTGKEARYSWSRLVRDYGDPAPGPAPAALTVPPPADVVRTVPSWWWRRHGVDRTRSDTIMRLARLPHVLAKLPQCPPEAARRLLTAVPGVGEWTYAEVAQRALGDADAVSVGDYHLAGQVVYAFTGARDGTDERMLELLQPFTGQRYRVVRAIELAGISRPRRGPRMPIPAHIYR